MSQEDPSSAALWRTAAAMSPTFTLEENNNPTDTEAGNLQFPSKCKEETSPEQREKSYSLVQVKLEPLPIEEEQQENSPSLVQVYLEPLQIKEELDKCPSLVQVKLEPPQIKEEQEEVLLRPMEAAVKSEDNDNDREINSQASTSTEHMKFQADIEDCRASQPTSDDQLLSSHCSESDTDDSDDWGNSDDETVVNTLESDKTQHVEGKRLSLSNRLSQNSKSLKQKTSTRSQTRKKSFCCTGCGKVCGHKGNLQKHMRIHTGERPFACTFCSKSFNRADHLKMHTVRFHMGKKDVVGKEDVVGKKAVVGEKPFACTVCDKSFNQSEPLKAHMRIHTGEKPFACTVCNKSFNHTSSVKKHMRTIHTDEKPFACTTCSQSFNRADTLKAHMRIHTGERPFACTICSKIFYTSGNMKTHMKMSHAGEQPFA